MAAAEALTQAPKYTLKVKVSPDLLYAVLLYAIDFT